MILAKLNALEIATGYMFFLFLGAFIHVNQLLSNEKRAILIATIAFIFDLLYVIMAMK